MNKKSTVKEIVKVAEPVEPKIVEVKQYTITLSRLDNGEEKFNENNIGFSNLELVGLLHKLVKIKT